MNPDDLLKNINDTGILIYDPAIKAQARFVLDPARSVAAFTTRRAGKSTGLCHRFLRTMLKYPNCFCPYIAITRDSAKNIMWPVLQAETQRFGIEASFTESNLTMTLTNGSRLQLLGANVENFIVRLKGIKTPGAAIDEAQDFRSFLNSLIDDVLTPATVDYEDGWIAVTGTPGPIPQGFFYDITEKGKHGYSVHSWSLFDNPYLVNAQQFVEDLKKKKGWASDNPTLLREYYGRWVLDLDVLLVRYNKELCDFSDLPPAKWNYILGIDLGYNDADALAVLAWSEDHEATYLVEEKVTAKQGLSDLVRQIEQLRDKYQISKLMIDEGGLGKKLAEEMRRRYRIPVQAADKQRKMETIAFLNDAIRRGHFKAKANSLFAEDSRRVQIDKDKTTPDRIVVKDSFHSDIIDAVLYAFKESPAYAYQKPVEKPKYGTPEWAEQEVTDMERAAEEYFSTLASNLDPFNY